MAVVNDMLIVTAHCHPRLILMCSPMYVGVAVPLLNKILKALAIDYSDLANVVDALNFLYKFLIISLKQ